MFIEAVSAYQAEKVQKKERKIFPFLRDTPPEATFRVAQENLKTLFGGFKDKKGNDLLQHYGQAACLSVLARVEHIAVALKETLTDTELLTARGEKPRPVLDETVEKVRKLVLSLSPLGASASEDVWRNYPDFVKDHDRFHAAYFGYDLTVEPGMYMYPAWDEMLREEDPQQFQREGHIPQELNFYHRLITHVLLAPIFVEELVGPVNQRIQLANQRQEVLPEKPFGYLKKEDGAYRTIDINRMKVRMLLHDIGRWATHHQDLHESLPDLIAHFLGMKPPLIDSEFDHEFRYYSEDESDVYPENIPIEEVIFHITDFDTKRKDETDLESTKLRNLDQLVEHALARAAGYNGALEKYLATIDEATPIAVKTLEALSILEASPDPKQAKFYRREIIFLEKIIPFFGSEEAPGILTEVGTSLEEVIEKTEQRFTEMIDEGELYALNRTERVTPPVTVRRIEQVFIGAEEER